VTLSEAVQKYKNRGNSRDRALRRAKERVEKAGEEWTHVKQNIFDDVWTGRKVIDVPARVPRTLKIQIGKPVKPAVPAHPPIHAPSPVAHSTLPVVPIVTPITEGGQLGQLHKEYEKMTQTTNINTATVFYLKLWHYFDTKHFGQHQMPVPVFRYLKDMGTRFGCRAHYMPSKNQLSFSRRLFNVDFVEFCNTFVHEMCHQAVHKIDEGRGYRTPSGKRDIHGSAWQKWMHHCGLKPQRCDMLDNTNYMNEDEKKVHFDKVEKKKEELADKVRVYPGLNKVARFYSPERKLWFTGIIVCPNDAKGKRWVFVSQTSGSTYQIVPADWFYEIEDRDREIFSRPEWSRHADEIRTKLTVFKQYKKDRTKMKKLSRSGW
jgi:hypothetical protein